MSQSTDAQVPTESIHTPVGEKAATQAKQVLSNFAVSNMETIAQAVGKKAAEGAADGALKNGLPGDGKSENKIDGSAIQKAMESFGKKIVDYTVTDKDRAEARSVLAKELSPLIPDADRAVLKGMQGALIDGNLDQLKDALAKLAGDPQKLEKFVREINKQFEKHGFNGPELSLDSKGNVLVYQKDGNTAVSINPKTGETTLRVVERQRDGTMVLKEGEVLNKKPADVMKAIGDDATRSIVGPWNKPRFDYNDLGPFYKLEKYKLEGSSKDKSGKAPAPPSAPDSDREKSDK